MRPIDADELLGIEKMLSTGARSTETRVLMEQVIFDIQQSPTINPEDLRPKGKWEQKRDHWNMFLNVCSNCGRSEFLAPPYCAGCGAKMED